MNQRAARAAGLPLSSGYKPSVLGDGLPTRKEIRDLARHFNGSNRGMQRGRAGRRPSLQFQAQVLAKLAAAAKAGRGLRWLSRDELDAVVAMLQSSGGKASIADVKRDERRETRAASGAAIDGGSEK